VALGAFGSMTGPEVADGDLFTFDTGEGLLPRGAGPPSLPVIPPGSGRPAWTPAAACRRGAG
jgi:hypothetical protein